MALRDICPSQSLSSIANSFWYFWVFDYRRIFSVCLVPLSLSWFSMSFFSSESAISFSILFCFNLCWEYRDSNTFTGLCLVFESCRYCDSKFLLFYRFMLEDGFLLIFGLKVQWKSSSPRSLARVLELITDEDFLPFLISSSSCVCINRNFYCEASLFIKFLPFGTCPERWLITG